MPASAVAVILAKYPEPGKVKTRLIGTVSATTAAAIHSICLRHALNVAQRADGIDVMLATTPPTADFSAFVDESIILVDQGDGPLGARLQRVAQCAIESGYDQVLLLGSDCPTLTSDDLTAAQAALSGCDLVIGPAEDGGYYLIGFSRYEARLFENIDWSTDRVLAQTIEQARRCELRHVCLRRQCDVDDAADLRALSTDIPENEDPVVRATRSAILDCVTESWNDD